MDFDSICESAQNILRDDGHAETILFAENQNGDLIMLPIAYQSAKEKQIAIQQIKLFILAHNIKEYIVVCESWMLVTNDPNAIKNSVSEHPDRIECLNIVHIKEDSSRLKIFKILRDNNNNIDLEFYVDEQNNNLTMMDGIIVPIPKDVSVNDQQKAQSILNAISQMQQIDENTVMH